ncbi:hypothetical protein MTO96_009825 [Rhipicephalus appendiculatus]
MGAAAYADSHLDRARFAAFYLCQLFVALRRWTAPPPRDENQIEEDCTLVSVHPPPGATLLLEKCFMCAVEDVPYGPASRPAGDVFALTQIAHAAISCRRARVPSPYGIAKIPEPEWRSRCPAADREMG